MVRSSITIAVSNVRRSLAKDRKPFDFEKIVLSEVKDSEANSVVSSWDLEVETRDAHDGNKVGASSMERFIRKYGRGNTFDHFLTLKELENKINAQENNFFCGHFNRQRCLDIIGIVSMDQDLPTQIIKQDTCKTWMVSFHYKVDTWSQEVC